MHGSYVPPNFDAGSVVGSVAMSAADSKLIEAGLKKQSEAARRKEEERTRLFTIVSTSVASMASKCMIELVVLKCTCPFCSPRAHCPSKLAVVTAVVAMYVEASIIAYIAFTFPLVTAPLAITQQRKLKKMTST